MLYQLNLILNSNQGLALVRQKQILRSNRHKNFQKQNNKDFFIQLLNAWLHFTNNNFRTPTSIEEILDQPMFLNPHTKLDFSSDNPYFYCIPPRNISDKFTIIRDLCRFLQPGLISSTTFDKKLGFPKANHMRIHKCITYLISNHWKHLLRTETSQKSFLETFYYNNKDTRKTSKNSLIKKFTSSFNLIVLNTTNLSNSFERHHILNPKIRSKFCDGYIFSNAIHRMGNAPNIRCHRCKELFNFKRNLVSCFNKQRDSATKLGSKETFLKTRNSFLNNLQNLNIQFN